ncbi:polyketide cyclase/dehydrase/lipid transport protein [Kribbella sp. VKM Ac-2527]|uniref:Polyketide cyclase/dehydrase/lipid transport protein n=1 Tax=Kribbella caucasensis TaxID=2512215 RepID=A0A4R6J4I2_9ACTN|nr:SRPBCC family protein [Kribbella sp. VKM Ac-2527]TDO29877.1 polyketide cyclase/dehydrase/lipid transport protein [Kribbella sp. VKM Ac-2527]
MKRAWRVAFVAAGGLLAGSGAYLGLVTGAAPVDLGIGRRIRSVGPLEIHIAAPPDLVFDVIAAPYAERTTRALRDKVRVIERGTDLVLAAHYTPIRGGLRATTVETVRFTRPERIDFRLVRGPVPHVVEKFVLSGDGDGTRLTYTGELGTDLWALGRLWGDLVAAKWLATVRTSLTAIQDEAEHRARHQR